MKEFIILSKRFVKFAKTADNEYQVSNVYDFKDGEMEDIVKRTVSSGKIIFVYDRHYPEDIREIVGEIDSLTCDNGEMKASIKWNALGEKILSSESRYPSVEIAPNHDNKMIWDLRAVAMVGEPASQDVDVLTLSATETEAEKKLLAQNGGAKMDDKVKEIIVKGMSDPASMSEELAKLFPDAVPLIEAIVDTLTQMNASKGGEGETEVEEKTEEELAETEEAPKAKADEEKGEAAGDEIRAKEKEAEAEEEKAEAKADEQKAKEELTALAIEHGARFDLGSPIAKTLAEATDRFIRAKKARMGKADAQEYAFKALKFVKAEPKKDEKLSSSSSNTPMSAAEEIGKAMRG